jgi:hypothetical protein
LLPQLAAIRWRAARQASRWDMIAADVQSFRPWVIEQDYEVWGRLLISAAFNLVWADGKDRGRLVELNPELKALGSESLHLSEQLFQLDYFRELEAGLFRLGRRNDFRSDFRRLIVMGWDGPSHEIHPLIHSYVAKVAKNPQYSLRVLDLVQTEAPHVLARLTELLSESGIDDDRPPTADDTAGVRSAADMFLSTSRWWRYQHFRTSLLDSPALVAMAINTRVEFTIPEVGHLSRSILSDTVLIHVYYAYELWRG